MKEYQLLDYILNNNHTDKITDLVCVSDDRGDIAIRWTVDGKLGVVKQHSEGGEDEAAFEIIRRALWQYIQSVKTINP